MADRLDVPITAAGVIFLLLVLAETISNPEGGVGTLFAITSWVLWALFVGEFLLRMFTGEPFFPEHAALRVVQIAVIAYSVVVFAALAATVGAFLLERRDDDDRRLRAAASRQRD